MEAKKAQNAPPLKEKQKNQKVRKRKVLHESYQFSLLNLKTLLGAHPTAKLAQ